MSDYLNKIICGDVFERIKEVPNNSVTLVLTSPPYSDVRKSYPGCPANNYVEWFIPLAEEILRILTPDGSFILNINDKCDKGERIPFAFELVIKFRELGFKFIDTNIWAKKNGAPAAGRRRSDYFEYIFHFAKTTKPKWFPDEIRTPYPESSLKRAQKPIKNNVSNREGREETQYKTWNLHPNGAYPKNVIFFPKDAGKNHVASFHIDLPTHYIKAHSEPGDIILDPFAGRGTTLQAAKLLNRRYLGFEIKDEHIELAKDLYNLESI
jgi:site-specific DNA-methyltransferase (adenine-specific)/site-specific DNA-methyltransferase (cytosine-N4-specific)